MTCSIGSASTLPVGVPVAKAGAKVRLPAHRGNFPFATVWRLGVEAGGRRVAERGGPARRAVDGIGRVKVPGTMLRLVGDSVVNAAPEFSGWYRKSTGCASPGCLCR